MSVESPRIRSLAAALVLTPLAIGAAGDLDRTFDGDGKVVTDCRRRRLPFDVASPARREDRRRRRELPDRTDRRSVITRYTASGALDPTFGSGGISRPDFGAFGSGMAVDHPSRRQDRGGRPGRTPCLAGLSTSCSPATTPTGRSTPPLTATAASSPISATAMAPTGSAIQPDGKIVAAGNARSSSSRDAERVRCRAVQPGRQPRRKLRRRREGPDRLHTVDGRRRGRRRPARRKDRRRGQCGLFVRATAQPGLRARALQRGRKPRCRL